MVNFKESFQMLTRAGDATPKTFRFCVNIWNFIVYFREINSYVSAMATC